MPQGYILGLMMNNQFTTVISYEKSVYAGQRAGRGMLKREAASLLTALAFMALWAFLTGLLVIEPLVSSLGSGSFRQDRVNFSLASGAAVQPMSAPAAAISGPPPVTALVAAKPSSAAKSPHLQQPAGPGSAAPHPHSQSRYPPSPTAPQPSAQAALNAQPSQLSYALLSVK